MQLPSSGVATDHGRATSSSGPRYAICSKALPWVTSVAATVAGNSSVSSAPSSQKLTILPAPTSLSAGFAGLRSVAGLASCCQRRLSRGARGGFFTLAAAVFGLSALKMAGVRAETRISFVASSAERRRWCNASQA